MTQIVISGAAGRMGRALIQTCLETPQTHLSAALEHPTHPALGTDAGILIGTHPLGIPLSHDLTTALSTSDILIDFTTVSATLAHIQTCTTTHKPLVIGTTGFTPEQKQHIKQAAQHIPIVFAPNMSIGVNLTFKLLELTAKTLGDSVDIEILEAHHRHKIDAPSGTALHMGDIIANALNRDLSTCAIYGREGKTGERDRKTIGFSTIRAGDIIGEHTVFFADTGERIEITHKASSRLNFAKGAIRAAQWLTHQPAGLYDMQDVLGLR